MADRALEGRGVWKKSAATGLWERHEPTGMDIALDALMHGSMADINTAFTSAAFHEASAEQAQQRRAAAAARGLRVPLTLAIGPRHPIQASLDVCVLCGYGPEDSDQRLLTVPKHFGGELPTLEAIEAAYRYDLPEDRVAELVARWKALLEAIEGARARQRRVAARVPLLLCRQRYYDQLEEGEVPGGDVVVKVAQPGIDGVFKHVAKFL
jgi:hypothetical protein